MKEAPHDWILTAPWYRWAQPGVPAAGRGSAPILQKYASTNFVADFLAEPQKSLLYVDEDYVHRVEQAAPKPKFSLSSLVRVRTERRKIFLDTHCRFYLVVVQLSCDQPGLPMVARDKVCQAGFVVRRKVAPAPEAGRQVLQAALGVVTALETRIAALEGSIPGRRGRVRAAIGDHCAEEIARLRVELESRRQSLRQLASSYGVELELEGWVAGEHHGFGEWREVTERPAQIAEEVYPLYPLVPDPADKKHSAQGKNLYFGLLPTGSRELDALGNPRFDDRSLYEVSCFVRRRTPCCEKVRCPDCKGELLWSRPSELYQLAPPMDLDGTSHKPVTITMPDLPALEAQAAAMKVGEGIGLRMVSPNKSALKFKTDPDDVGNPGSASTGGLPQICSFAIPLITIVATFVLNLFLPIVVFAFGLWFLLKLKFCILPSFELDAGLAASLSVTPPGIDFDASLSVGVEGAFGFNLGSDGAAGLKSAYGGDLNVLGSLALDLGSDFRDQAPPEIAADLPPKDPQYPAPRQPLPILGAGLQYYPRVEMPT